MLSSNHTKRILILLALIMLAGLLAGCGKEIVPEEEPVKVEGMSIVLGKEYQESTLANATWYYTSPDGLAMGIRSRKDDVEKSGLEVSTARDYAEAYIKANSIPGSPTIRNRSEYAYFEYSRKVSGTDYAYLTCVFDNKDEFWLVNFACYKELYKEKKADFLNAADTVVFED